jgi:hypothetical protein
MSNKTRALIRAKLDAVKKINDDPKLAVDDVYDLIKDDLPSIDGAIRRNVDQFKSKLKSKKTQQKDIFGEIIKTVEGFLGTDGSSKVDVNKKPKMKNKLKKYAQDSAHTTLHASKQIVTDSAKNFLFSGGGVCGGNSLMPSDSIEISPSEFDLTNMLKISPSSTSGQIMYENDTPKGYSKLNTEFFNSFDSGQTFFFNNKDYKTLFNLRWNDSTQKYMVSGLKGSLGNAKVSEFLTDYYANIEYPEISDIVRNAMLQTIQGDGNEPQSSVVGMNQLDRLLQKLFSVCGNQQKNQPLDQTPTSQVNENDEDIESYFNFDDVEGIDLDDENARLRRVLRFVDCNNFETPISTSHIEDFVYFTKKNKKTLDESTENTLNKVAVEAYEKSGGGISLDNFQISIAGLFILKLPKALISAILSPKIFFPIVVVYKLFKSSIMSAAQIMKKLSKLFFDIVQKVFWRFIQEFWSYVKKDLLEFIKKIAIKILKNKLKRWKTILTALINLLLALLNTNLDSCEAIFSAILATITGALNAKIKIPIPGLLLALSDMLPGYSVDKAYMQMVERISSNGTPMGALYGRENKFSQSLYHAFTAHDDVMSTDSFIKIAMKPAVIPATQVAAYLTPLNAGVGKLF